MVDFGEMFNDGLDDITFGAWSAAYNAYQSVTSTAGDIASGVAGLAGKATTLVDDLDSVLNDADSLIKIKLPASRNVTELSADEAKIYFPLYNQELKLRNDYLTKYKQPMDTASLENFVKVYLVSNNAYRRQHSDQYSAAKVLLDLRKAIMDILWSRPGVVLQTLTNVRNVLDRVNTVEQPLVETTLGDVNKVLNDADATVKKFSKIVDDADTLLVVDRLVPRDVSELNDDERTYLGDLRKRMDDLQKEMQDYQAKLDYQKSTGKNDPQTLQQISELTRDINVVNAKYLEANNAIISLFNTQPGKIPQTLYDVDCLVQNVDALIATDRIVPRTEAELNETELQYVNDLWARMTDNFRLQTEKAAALNKLKASGAHDPATLKQIDALKEDVQDLQWRYDMDDAEVKRIMNLQPGIIADTINSVDLLVKQATAPVTNAVADFDRLLTVRRTAARDPSELTPEEQKYLGQLQQHEKDLDADIQQKQGQIDALIASGATDQATQDQIASLQWQFGNVKKAEQDNYREIIRLQYTQPGIVADALYDVHKTVERLNKEEQPRVEKIMDSVNHTVLDTQKILARVNAEEQPRVEKLLDNVNDRVTEARALLKSVDNSVVETKVLLADADQAVKKINGALDTVAKYKLPILIAAGLAAIVWIAISIVTLLLLLKILLGPNPL